MYYAIFNQMLLILAQKDRHAHTHICTVYPSICQAPIFQTLLLTPVYDGVIEIRHLYFPCFTMLNQVLLITRSILLISTASVSGQQHKLSMQLM